MSVLEQVQADVRTAMKAGERERAAALRMVVDSLQQDAKLGNGDEVAVLQRERKKRLEAEDAYREADRGEQADAEKFEAELIESGLEVAAEHGLTAYDAAYVAAARRHDWTLVSADIADLVSKGLAVAPDAANYP